MSHRRNGGTRFYNAVDGSALPLLSYAEDQTHASHRQHAGDKAYVYTEFYHALLALGVAVAAYVLRARSLTPTASLV